MGVLHLASEGPLSCVALETNPGTRDGNSHNKQTADSWFEHAAFFFLSTPPNRSWGEVQMLVFWFSTGGSHTD